MHRFFNHFEKFLQSNVHHKDGVPEGKMLIKMEESHQPEEMFVTCGPLGLAECHRVNGKELREDALVEDPSTSIDFLSEQEIYQNGDDGEEEEELGVLPDNLEPILELRTGAVSDTKECSPEEYAIIEMAEKKFELQKLKKVFHCDDCDSGFSSKDTLKKHIKYVHKKIKPFQCSQCETAFALRKDLKRHVDCVHLKVKAFTCPECNASFMYKKYVKTHIETVHLNLKPYKCLYCSSCFTQKGNLNMHTNSVHFKIKPFKCAVCDASFATKNDLKKHIASVHDKIKPFKCIHCDKAFTQKTDMSRHVDTVHLNLRTFKCTECAAAFAFQRYLTRHFETVHLRQYKCFKCDITFPKKCNLKAHVKTPSHHQS